MEITATGIGMKKTISFMGGTTCKWNLAQLKKVLSVLVKNCFV
jgi:hypothetical protein